MTPSSTLAPPLGTADPRVTLPLLCSLDPVASWLSRPSPEEEPGGSGLGRRSCLTPLVWHMPWGLLPWFHLLRREGQLARERAEAVMTLSTEQGFPFWLAYGTVVRGWALAEQGQVEEGIAQMQQGLAACRAMGAELVRTALSCPAGRAYGKAGQIEEGLSVLAEALALVDKTGERFYEAELYRLKGAHARKQSKSRSKVRSLEPIPDP